MREQVKTAVEGLSAKARREYFVDHGLCPLCGEEAAPWYFCWEHRRHASLSRLLNKMAARDVIKKVKRGWYQYGGERKLHDYQWGKTLWDFDQERLDKLRPRINRKPVDLHDTLLAIFENAGRALTEDEIVEAWGKLRSRRKHEILANDMSKLILAQRKREARNAKRLANAS